MEFTSFQLEYPKSVNTRILCTFSLQRQNVLVKQCGVIASRSIRHFLLPYSRANDMTRTPSHYIFSLSFRAQRVSKPDFALVVRKITKIMKPTALVPVSRVNFYPGTGSSVPSPRLSKLNS